MNIEGKTALVTGGAVRVGRAIALGLAETGARIIVHYNGSEVEATQVVAEIQASGGEAALIGADLSRQNEVERLARDASHLFGGVDILVNNASIFPAEGFSEVDAELWERTMAINLRAPFFLTQHLGGRMRDRGEGVVVNIADLAGIQVWSAYAAHSISKAGIVHLTRVAARALAPQVRVVAIAPGTVLPPEDLSEEEVAKLAARTPLKRNGSPRDVVDSVLYLIRAPFVTGEVLILDGGRTLTG